MITPGMRIARLEVTNLRRSSPETEVVALRADKNLVALLGANNTGKSNLIDAVGLALAAAARRSDLEPADPHQLGLSEQIRVELRLLRRDAPLTASDEDEVHE
jgi:recombinational DNA repair ATPase RecF